MRFWLYAVSVSVALFVVACGSCRREKKADGAPASKEAAVSSVIPASSRPALPPADPQVTAAVGKRQQAERDWLARMPEAAAALKRLTEAQSAYQRRIDVFGLYKGPVHEREARMRELMAAREKGDEANAARAEKAFQEANAAVDQAEATLRQGNPPIQEAYDEWLAARKAYAELRDSEEAISKASAELKEVAAKQDSLDKVRNDQVKEN